MRGERTLWIFTSRKLDEEVPGRRDPGTGVDVWLVHPADLVPVGANFEDHRDLLGLGGG